MSILSIGSINIDHVYRVSHHPHPGETLADQGYASHLGGKGANMSLAATLAGARVAHVGAVGSDGLWCRDRLAASGVDVSGVAEIEVATGHAIIMVDDAGENVILIHAGANRVLTEAQIETAVSQAAPGDWLLVQNETNLVGFAAKLARETGLNVAYAAAPFDTAMAREVLPYVDLLAVNSIEASQLAEALGARPDALPVPAVLVTCGAKGARFRDRQGSYEVDAFAVKPVDTTGAGDTFFGYFLARLDEGFEPEEALLHASAASAIQITRHGAADAIPASSEVNTFLADQA
ncbi:MAG: ribokinase [Paracoccaceae bacterium]